jgi:hypothetical protein
MHKLSVFATLLLLHLFMRLPGVQSRYTDAVGIEKAMLYCHVRWGVCVEIK